MKDIVLNRKHIQLLKRMYPKEALKYKKYQKPIKQTIDFSKKKPKSKRKITKPNKYKHKNKQYKTPYKLRED